MSGSESASGISSASVRSGPKARAHSPTVTELSMPPETPTTAPRRRSRGPTIVRSAATISSATRSASIVRALGCRPRPSSSGLAGPVLPLDEARRCCRSSRGSPAELLVVDPDVELLLEEADELEHAGRVDEPGLDQRARAGELGRVVAEEEVGGEEFAQIAVPTAIVTTWNRPSCTTDLRHSAALFLEGVGHPQSIRILNLGMCGIAGIYGRRGRPADRRLLLTMAGELRHRGPDGDWASTSTGASAWRTPGSRSSTSRAATSR